MSHMYYTYFFKWCNIHLVERCNVSVNPDSQKCFPAKISSRLSSWKRYTFTDFEVSFAMFKYSTGVEN